MSTAQHCPGGDTCTPLIHQHNAAGLPEQKVRAPAAHPVTVAEGVAAPTLPAPNTPPTEGRERETALSNTDEVAVRCTPARGLP